MTTTEPTDQEKFQYMLLSRYKSDLEYYFGWGGRNVSRLYKGDFNEHISEMRKMRDSLKVKPEYLTEADLERYEKLYKTPSPATQIERDYVDYLDRSNTCDTCGCS